MKDGKIIGTLVNQQVAAQDSDLARELYDKGRYGEQKTNKKFHYSLLEALYLQEKEKMILQEKKREISPESIVKKAKKEDKNFFIRYSVYRDMRDRGYIVKTALKFGADFRVYDRGVKPGDDHAKWILYPVHESAFTTWYEFAAKNRVAHSTRKRLLLGIVDDEGDVTYYEIRWTRP